MKKHNIPLKEIRKHIRDSGWNPEIERKNKIYQPIFDVNDFRPRIETHGKLLSDTLENALDDIGPKGYIATLPELLQLETEGIINENDYTSHSEENIGIDTKGIHGKKGDIVIAVVHGGGILTPELLRKEDELTNTHLAYEQKKFDNLLLGKLETGEHVDVYNARELQKGTNIPHRCIITQKFKVEYLSSSKLNQKEFLKNDFVLARVGNKYFLEQYTQTKKKIDYIGTSSILLPNINFRFPNPIIKPLVLYGNVNGFGNPYFMGNEARLLYVTKK